MSSRQRLREFRDSIRASVLGHDPGILAIYYKLFYRPTGPTVTARIDAYAKGKCPFYFLQIGGNDGFIKDPIFRLIKKHPWKGIIVEPQKSVFEKKLKKTYRCEKKVILENSAIADQSGRRKLWKISVSDSRWATGLASFNKDALIFQIERNYVADGLRREGKPIPKAIDEYLTYEKVECITIHDLLEKHQFDRLDLLQIDTEGYDYEIIKTIDFGRLKPGMISYESDLLTEQDRSDCKKLLIEHGFVLEELERDTVAVLQEPTQSIST